MKYFVVRGIVAAGCVMTIMASGGSGNMTLNPPPVTTPTPTPTPTYETLTSTASSTSPLAGSAIRSNGTTGTLDVTTTSGTLTHNTGATTVSDGTYSLTDADGISGGVLTDGSSTLTSNGSQGFTGTYEYVRAYNQTYISGGVTYDSNGVNGIVTSSTDVPTTGSATYTGEARGVVVTGVQGFDLNNGTSTVNADFGSGTVNATMTGFSATNQATGAAATAPIDTISATGMTISGNGFSGGTITTSNGGVVTSVTGTNTTTAGQGHFFGYDGTNARPDEVGGNILIQGDNGRVLGTFIAD